MDVKIQLTCMLVSFLYGIFIRIVTIINKRINNNKNLIIHTIIDLLFVYIIVLLYVIIIYKINEGIFHIYFLFLVLLGYILSNKYVNFTIQHLKNIKNKIIK